MIYKKFTFKEKKFFLKFHLLLLHFKIKESSPNSKKQLLFSHSGHPKFQKFLSPVGPNHGGTSLDTKLFGHPT